MTLALEFLGDLHGALFTPTVVLLVAVAWRRPAWRSRPALRLAMVAITVTLALRALFAVCMVPVSTRYFLGLTVLALPFAAAGVAPAADCLAYCWRRCGGGVLAPVAAQTLILAIVFIFFIGKGLKPESRAKPWLREIPRLMTEEAGGAPPLLVSDLDDLRLAYFAGGQQVKLCHDRESIRAQAADGTWPKVRCHGGELADRGLRQHAGDWLKLPGAQGWDHLAARLREIPAPVFLAVRQEDAAFRDEFFRRNLPFPFRPVREFRERKGRPPIMLYRFDDDA